MDEARIRPFRQTIYAYRTDPTSQMGFRERVVLVYLNVYFLVLAQYILFFVLFRYIFAG